ncbi:MAG: molybdopterin-dependent oxidoreductase [Coriobacteriales bacterium]
MTLRIDIPHDSDESKGMRPTFFNEPPVMYTGGDLPYQWEEDGMVCTRSAAWSAPGCHDGCGVIVYTDKETGKFIKVEGDEENPYYQGRLCMRCLDVAEALYHPDRLLYPMKRDPKDRGKADKWERITWDEAYDMIDEKFTKIRDEYGGKSIIFASGTGRVTPPINARLGYALGSIQYSYFHSGNACYVPRVAAANTIQGCYTCPDFSMQFPDRYDNPEWVAPKNIFVWGNNPLIANADGNLGHWIVDCMKRGSKLIVVDPRLTWLAAKADLWLQIRPGTDSMLALAMGKYIMENDLYDHDFVDKWCYGFDEYKEACEPYNLEWAAEVTWLDKEDIIAAAEYMAEKPTAVQWGLAIDMNLQCVTASQALCNLWCITGQIDIPGGMITVHDPYNTEVWLPPDPREVFTPIQEKERIGSNYEMITNSGMVQCQADSMIDQLVTGRPFKIRAAWIQSTNPLACCAQDPEPRVEKGLKNCEFVVGVDCFMTPTLMANCDVVLPLCFYPEREGLRSVWYYIQNTNKACEPMGESKDDFQINWELGRRWNKDLWPGETLEEYFSYLIEEAGITYDQSRKLNWIYPEFHYRKYEKGEQRPDGQLGFNTPTGRIELWSTLLAAWGQKPLPYFAEPPMSPYSQPELYKEYPLVLTTGARHYESFHSEHRQMSRLRSRLPQPQFEIHPDKARELGIEDGDWCWIESPIGRCREVARVTPIVDPRVVQADHGWWFPEADPEDQGEGCFATYARNINVCLPSECGDTGFGNQSKCYLCKVYKCTPEEIPLPEPAQPKDRFAEGSFRNFTLEAEMEA